MNRAVLWVALLFVVGACGDAAPTVESAAVSTPPSVPVVGTGTAEEWCAVVDQVDPSLPLFAGVVFFEGTLEENRAAMASLGDAYAALAPAAPPEAAEDLAVVRSGYASLVNDMEVVGYESALLLSAVGQREWQSLEYTSANRRLVAYTQDACGLVTSTGDVNTDFMRDALTTSFESAGLTPDKAACMADVLATTFADPAADAQGAFDVAMAGCGLTLEDFAP